MKTLAILYLLAGVVFATRYRLRMPGRVRRGEELLEGMFFCVITLTWPVWWLAEKVNRK